MKFNLLNTAIGVGGLILLLQYYDSQKPETNKGLRNNNAGNIRRTKDLWIGEVPHEQSTDPNFKQFRSWTYGIRAMIGLLYRYYFQYDKRTIRDIVYMYAPPSDNNWSEKYVAMVANDTKINPNEVFEFNIANIRKLVKAMTKVELGGDYVKDVEFMTAWTMFVAQPNQK